jgi:hypothetical protein
MMWPLILFFGLIALLCGWLIYEYRRIVELERNAAERDRLMRELWRKRDKP